MKRNDPVSLAMLLLSMVIYGSIGIFRRNLPLPSAVLACYRGICGGLLLTGAAALQRKGSFRHIGIRKALWLALSGAVMGFNWILLFEAYNYTTVATATLCYYMQPTIVILLSPMLFREKITLKKGLCVLVSAAGMVLISGLIESGIPAFSELRGILFGLGAAVLYSIVVIINKMLPGIDAYGKTIIQLLAAGIVLIPYILLTGGVPDITPDSRMIVLLLIIGFVHTGIAYMLYFGSMDGLRTQTVAVCGYLDPVTALFLSAFLLHENLSVYGCVGAVLIIGAGLISEFI